MYEYFVCLWHGHTCQSFRDVATLSGDNFAVQYERTMSRLEQITRACFQVKMQWECEYDEKAELLAYPIMRQTPLCTRDALYVGRTEAMRLHYKGRENKAIQYVDVISLYPYICQYSHRPPHHSCGRCVQISGSLLAYGRFDNVYYRSATDIEPSGPSL